MNISLMPQVRRAFANWRVNCLLKRQIQDVTGGYVMPSWETVSFQGHIQPFYGESIEFTNSGQRSWNWIKVYVFSGLKCNTGDRIVWNGKSYKIMRKRDWSMNGYIQLEAVEDFAENS